jgi:probable F420-dependent oxidoreductase
MKVRIAVAPGAAGFDPDGYAALVDGLEAHGFDTLWLSDIPLGSTVDPVVGLAFAASRTTRLKLGANVVPIGRNPMTLAKELAQLDQLSQGRVLLSLVPGVNQPGEREALGFGPGNRGAYLEEVIPLLRQWWAGAAVDHHSDRLAYSGITVRPAPVQDPLEIWLGGIGPAALTRVGQFADGWLGAALAPSEASGARRHIEEAAAGAGRTIDPEHFGLSIGYARHAPDAAMLAALAARRPDVDPADLLPVGAAGLRDFLCRYVDAGVSKFVVRAAGGVTTWEDELSWLADVVLPLQT